jgi:hypothetical protein
MTTPPTPMTGPLLIADCPLCATPSSLDEDAGTLACLTCGVVLEIADDASPELLLAA